jgi:hypothetical protein
MSGDRDAWTTLVNRRLRIGLTAPQPVPRPKYGARPVTVDGIRFDSTKEATRYQELKVLVAGGVIRDLRLQPPFPLAVVELWRDGPPWVVTPCGVYTADFQYVDATTGEVVVEDVKSGPTKTTAYQLRKRIAEAVHGITIREV